MRNKKQGRHDVPSWVMRSGVEYWSLARAADYLEVKTATLHVAHYASRHKKTTKYEKLIKDAILFDKVYYYPKQAVFDFMRECWEREDFVYKVLNAIDDLRGQKAISLTEIANYIGTSPQSFIGGVALSNISFERARKIAEYLELRLDYRVAM